MRVNITVDEGTLRRIDAVAATRGLSRPAFLAEAARRAIEDKSAAWVLT